MQILVVMEIFICHKADDVCCQSARLTLCNHPLFLNTETSCTFWDVDCNTDLPEVAYLAHLVYTLFFISILY